MLEDILDISNSVFQMPIKDHFGKSAFSNLCGNYNQTITDIISSVKIDNEPKSKKINEDSYKCNKPKSKLINNFLEICCKSMEYIIKSLPNCEKVKIRAVVVKCDYKKEIRETIYSYNAGPDSEKTFDLPIYLLSHSS